MKIDAQMFLIMVVSSFQMLAATEKARLPRFSLVMGIETMLCSNTVGADETCVSIKHDLWSDTAS